MSVYRRPAALELPADDTLDGGVLSLELHAPRWKRLAAWALGLRFPRLVAYGFQRGLTFREAWAGRVVLLSIPPLR